MIGFLAKIRRLYHNNISRNIIVNNLRGIHISVIRSLNHTISENTIENNTYGIFLWSHLDYDWLFDGHGPRVDKESTVISNDQLIFPFLRPNIITKNNFMNNNYNANFSVNRFFSLRWINNFWESPHLLPKLIFGIMNWRGEKRKWINFDFRPAKEPYDIPRIAI